MEAPASTTRSYWQLSKPRTRPRHRPPEPQTLFGSQRNRSEAITTAPAPHAAMIDRSVLLKPLDDWCAGSNAVNIALMKWRTGNTSAICASTDDDGTGKNVPEMKTIGRNTAFTIAGAASA